MVLPPGELLRLTRPALPQPVRPAFQGGALSSGPGGRGPGVRSSGQVQRQDPEPAHGAAPSPALISWLRSCLESGSALRVAYISGCGRVAGSARRSQPARSPWKLVPGYPVAASSQDAPLFLTRARPGLPRRKRETWRGVKGREEEQTLSEEEPAPRETAAPASCGCGRVWTGESGQGAHRVH